MKGRPYNKIRGHQHRSIAYRYAVKHQILPGGIPKLLHLQKLTDCGPPRPYGKSSSRENMTNKSSHVPQVLVHFGLPNGSAVHSPPFPSRSLLQRTSWGKSAFYNGFSSFRKPGGERSGLLCTLGSRHPFLYSCRHVCVTGKKFTAEHTSSPFLPPLRNRVCSQISP